MFLIRFAGAWVLASTVRVLCAISTSSLLCSSAPVAAPGLVMQWAPALCTLGAGGEEVDTATLHGAKCVPVASSFSTGRSCWTYLLFLIRCTGAQVLAGAERALCANAAFALLCSNSPVALLGCLKNWAPALCNPGAVGTSSNTASKLILCENDKQCCLQCRCW